MKVKLFFYICTMNKNRMYNCEGNEEADSLLCMLESNSVLSESFTRKISNIVLVIVSNLESNEEYITDSINDLRDEMDWLIIFSEEFKRKVIGQLTLAYRKQKTLNDGK